ncbi:endolytic transglycosylase MltG [Pradoshia sp. D12]|uniref:endolytic transglycosylase MltG n=1 Tax=Bacillaceae TaxID=186817 RepID=UPI00112ED72C|nr:MULTISPECIES: endolytic transglycosylase MltG [Bacillaceae]QFK70572.1 endolytic transglycosylase MltG [Pradoshia sp. D12]TPF72368.1 endolytic transglycosylase MltG [Bacillus sp. D12]
MTPKVLSSFAAGIIVAAGVCGAVYFSSSEEETVTQAAESPKNTVTKEMTEDEMKNELSSLGYVIKTEDEYSTELQKAEQTAKENSNQQDQQVVYKTVINVASGMTSIDVAQALVKGKIIKDASSFTKTIESRKLENKLKPGVFEVDSTMSMDEVINHIFK